MDMSLSKLWELVMDREPGVLKSVGLQRVGHDWVIGLATDNSLNSLSKWQHLHQSPVTSTFQVPEYRGKKASLWDWAKEQDSLKMRPRFLVGRYVPSVEHLTQGSDRRAPEMCTPEQLWRGPLGFNPPNFLAYGYCSELKNTFPDGTLTECDS